MALVSKTFSEIITFTRASTATYFDSAGVLQSAAINAPRLDYNPSTLAAQGLLIEEQRTNLPPYSEQFDNAAWTKTGSTVTANATTAPTGTVVADKLVEDTSTGGHLCLAEITGAPDTTIYTSSCFCKASERNWVAVAVQDKAGGINRVWFNLSTGAQGATNGTVTAFSAVNVGNGWYRLAVSASSVTGASNVQIRISIGSADNTAAYTGNGTSGIFIFGAQLEAGAFPTSYIPTTTAAVTRAADVASINTLSPWFNATEGSFFVQASNLLASAPALFSTDDGTTNNRIINFFSNPTTPSFRVISGGVDQANISSGAISLQSTFKLASAYKVNDFAASLNGAAAVVDTSGTIPSGQTTARLGSNVVTAGLINGYLQRITYYPRRLTNSELQALTA